jgi:diguanylate cyclase (GGDEF)-like protein/putative nucleotidyltransferase with HDIG domain
MTTETGASDVEAGSTGGAEIDDVLRLCGSTLTHSPLPLVAAEGRDHTMRYVNPAFCRLVGKATAELIGRPFALAVPEAEANGCMALLDRVYLTSATETLTDQEHAPSHAGSPLPGVYWSYVAWPVIAAEGRTVAVMIQVTDTTASALFHRQMTTMNQELLLSNVRQHEQREVVEALNAELQVLATTDGLTGLNNHRAFQELLRKEVERTRRYNAPLSLLLLDVDDFKLYNDAFGHPAGDDVLRKVGKVLRATARANDQVARYGGEEFAVILLETDAQSARLAAERFRAAIERAGWQKRQITLSVGAVTLSETVHAPAALIAEADTALYRSKARGRNCVTHRDDVYNSEENVEETAPATKRHGHILPSPASRKQAMSEFRATVEGAGNIIGQSLQHSQDAMVSCLLRLVELRDEETQEHSVRVTEMMMRLADAAGMDAADVLLTKWGGLLHDIGKIGIPDAILRKPGPLTNEERMVMQSHPVLASEMFSSITFLVGPALDIPRYHHEKYDGSGYPYGLKGEDIPLSARLFAVVDVYDALLSDRPYRKAWKEEEVRRYLHTETGTHFDPAAVQAFLSMLEAQEGKPANAPQVL